MNNEPQNTPPTNTLIPLHLRAEQRLTAKTVAAIPEPRFPGTGTSRIAARLAEAKQREHEERRRRLARAPHDGRPEPPR